MGNLFCRRNSKYWHKVIAPILNDKDEYRKLRSILKNDLCQDIFIHFLESSRDDIKASSNCYQMLLLEEQLPSTNDLEMQTFSGNYSCVLMGILSMVAPFCNSYHYDEWVHLEREIYM
jgi:hypothetical protein